MSAEVRREKNGNIIKSEASDLTYFTILAPPVNVPALTGGAGVGTDAKASENLPIRSQALKIYIFFQLCLPIFTWVLYLAEVLTGLTNALRRSG